MNTKPDRILIVLSYLMIYLVWGSTYYFIKSAVTTIPPAVAVSARWTAGGLLFLGWAFLKHGKAAMPGRREFAGALLMGVLLILIPNGLVTAAETKVDSHLAALIMAGIPVAAAVFDRVLTGRRIAPVSFAGVCVGLAGTALLLYDGRSLVSSLSFEVLMIVAAVVSWSLATVLGRRIVRHSDPVVHTGWQMLLAGLLCGLVAPVFETVPAEDAGGYSARSLLALAYLVGPGSVAYAAYNYLLSREPAVRVTSYALVNPAIAVLLGLVFGGETGTPLLAAGFPLTLGGLFLMLYGAPLLARLHAGVPGSRAAGR